MLDQTMRENEMVCQRGEPVLDLTGGEIISQNYKRST